MDPQNDYSEVDNNAFCPNCRTRGRIEFHTNPEMSHAYGRCENCSEMVKQNVNFHDRRKYSIDYGD